MIKYKLVINNYLQYKLQNKLKINQLMKQLRQLKKTNNKMYYNNLVYNMNKQQKDKTYKKM